MSWRNLLSRQSTIICLFFLSTLCFFQFQSPLSTICITSHGSDLKDTDGFVTDRNELKFCPQWNRGYECNFLNETQHTKGWGDVYSGMWWQSIDSMLQSNFSEVGSLEAISFQTFRNHKKVIHTVDWLDFCVEHLSKYVKHFILLDSYLDESKQNHHEEVRNAIQNLTTRVLQRFIDSSPKGSCRQIQSYYDFDDAEVSSTIAILPLRITSLENDYLSHLVTLQTAATLASLDKVGIPRAVIVGVTDNEKYIAQRSFEMLKDRLIELSYVDVGTSSSEKEWKLVPKLALVEFHRIISVFNENYNRRNINSTFFSWLGPNPSRWKNIYFSEPDLILHIRPRALRSLSLELRKGHILNSHRLQPIPHMQQFADIYSNITHLNKELADRLKEVLLPNLASFSAVHQLNQFSRNDTCYDQGKFYPAHTSDPSTPLTGLLKSGKCKSIWEFCGFLRPERNYSDWADLLGAHKMLLPYPLLSLEGGTGLPLVHHGQRVCIPHRAELIIDEAD